MKIRYTGCLGSRIIRDETVAKLPCCISIKCIWVNLETAKCYTRPISIKDQPHGHHISIDQGSPSPSFWFIIEPDRGGIQKSFPIWVNHRRDSPSSKIYL